MTQAQQAYSYYLFTQNRLTDMHKIEEEIDLGLSMFMLKLDDD